MPGAGVRPDGNRLVACGTTGKVVVWDTATRRQILTIKLPAASVRYAMVACEPDRAGLSPPPATGP